MFVPTVDPHFLKQTGFAKRIAIVELPDSRETVCLNDHEAPNILGFVIGHDGTRLDQFHNAGSQVGAMIRTFLITQLTASRLIETQTYVEHRATPD
jgi:hypothetical protein